MIKDIVKHPEWEDVEAIIQKKMRELVFSLDRSKPMNQIGMEALANLKAYEMLNSFLTDMRFFKGSNVVTPKRDFK